MGRAHLGLLVSTVLFGQEGGLRLTLENVGMPPGDRMGMMGVTLERFFSPNWSAGMSLFGAVRGRRGGFLTSGVDLTGRRPLGAGFSMEGGLFVGGGGGDPGRTYGNGLMLRPFLGLARRMGDRTWALEASRVHFPSGSLDSTQLALRYEARFPLLARWEPPRDDGAAPWLRPGFLEAFGQRLTGPGPLYSLSGKAETPPPTFLGFMVGLGSDPRWFWLVEGSAAVRGEAENYNEFLVGVGARWPVAGPASLRGTLNLGSGGGRTLGAGGGLIGKAALMARVDLPGRWYAGMEIGHFRALGTPLRGTTTTARVGWDFDVVQPGPRPSGARPLREVLPLHWRFRPMWSHFQHAQRAYAFLKDEPVGMFGFAVDAGLGERFYATGQIQMAAKGSAGSWGTGMLGGGWQSPAWHGQRLVAELMGGTTAGGGLDIRGGGAWQAMAGWRGETSQGWGLQAMGGRLKAFQGRFDTPIFTLGLVFRGDVLLGR